MGKWYSVIRGDADPNALENWMRLLLTEQKAEKMREEGYIAICI